GFMAFGSVIGGIICIWLEKKLSLIAMLYLSIALGVVAQGSFLLLSSKFSAVALSLGFGITTMISLVAALALAADLCPNGAEGFAYAILASLSNLSYQLSDKVGSLLYERVFDHSLNPLIIITAGFTLAAA